MKRETAMSTVDETAQSQHGLIERWQLTDAGLGPSGVARWLRAGRLKRVSPRVYRLAGTTDTWEQRLLGAVLAAGQGATASHRSAAALWGLLDGPTEVVEVAIPGKRQPRLCGVLVHRSSDLTSAMVCRRNGIAVTNALRTIVDLGAVLPGNLVEDALDRALVRRLVTVRAVELALNRVGRPGRNGAGVLRQVLNERALGSARPDSLLEPRMARVLVAAGLPPAEFQYQVRNGGVFVGRVDFAYPQQRLALEVDGFEAHATPDAMQRDHDRQNLLVDAGWSIRRFTWVDVVQRPWKVADGVRRALCARSVE